ITAPLVVDERTVVTLDASQSSDPDGEPILGYLWTQVVETGKPVVKLSNWWTMKSTFLAPEVQADTQLTFKLLVGDGWMDSAPQTVTLTVRHVDRAPVVDAGAAVSVKTREQVTLTGKASDPEGDVLTSVWTQHAGEPQVALTGADTAKLTFTAPDVGSATLLHFDLTATANGLTSTDTVEVTVQPVNRKPVAHAPASATARSGEAVTLEGSATDEDGDTLIYVWKQVEGPTVTLEGASTASAHFTAPDVKSETRLVFELVARDEAFPSDPVRTEVTVLPAAGGCSSTGGATPLVSMALLAVGLLLLRRRAGGERLARTAPGR
ncbi:MAG: Ig-like domain-containing protein, partial [Myxococcaceae bacterium]|nr:Ig-like domain-containing protein [Myxococcaceae bacterium]